MQRDHLVAVLARAIPGTVQRHHGRAAQGRGPALALEERDPERRVVRAERVDGRDRAGDLRCATGPEIRIRHAIAVREGPAVEASGHDAVELAGRQVVAQQIAAVVGGVELAVRRPPCEADRVAQPGREDLAVGAVGTEAQDGGPAWIVLDAHVAARADRHVHPAVRPEAHGARPVVAAGGQALHHALDRALGTALCRVEAHAHDRAGLAHVEPSLVQIDPVRAIEALEQRAHDAGAAVALALDEDDAPGARQGHEHVTERRDAQEARVGQAARPQLDREAVGSREQGADLVGRRRRATPPEQHVRERRVHGIALGQEEPAGGRGQRDEQQEPQEDAHEETGHERARAYRARSPSLGAKGEFPRGAP